MTARGVGLTLQSFKRPKYVLSITFAPDGKTLTGDSEGNVLIWSSLVTTIEVTGCIQAHSVCSISVARLLTAGRHSLHCGFQGRLCHWRTGWPCQDLELGVQGELMVMCCLLR